MDVGAHVRLVFPLLAVAAGCSAADEVSTPPTELIEIGPDGDLDVRCHLVGHYPVALTADVRTGEPVSLGFHLQPSDGSEWLVHRIEFDDFSWTDERGYAGTTTRFDAEDDHLVTPPRREELGEWTSRFSVFVEPQQLNVGFDWSSYTTRVEVTDTAGMPVAEMDRTFRLRRGEDCPAPP